jgi:hypothetical protein
MFLPVVSDINHVAINFSGAVSVYESEVQPLVAFNSRRLEIVSFLLRRQLCPLPFFARVAPHIVLLHGDVQCNIEHRDGDQGTISLLCRKSVSAGDPVTQAFLDG